MGGRRRAPNSESILMQRMDAFPKSLIMNLGTNFEGHHLDQKILGAGPESEQTTQNQEISQYFEKFLTFFFVDRFRTDPEKILNRP